MNVILASQSPRRRELLGQLGLEFTVRPADCDETMDPARPAREEVCRVSQKKAEAVQSLCTAEDVIVAADTIVVCDGEVMGKPHTAEEAKEMLRRLSGRVHQVMTGIAVTRGERMEAQTVITDVCFRDLSEAEIEAYVATGEPMDKAGAYGIQGLAGIFVRELRGDYFNVVGLPICALTELLRSFGLRILE